MIRLISFLKRFIAKKICTACSKINTTIAALTNLNKCIYNDKSETEVNINNSEKKNCLKTLYYQWAGYGRMCLGHFCLYFMYRGQVSYSVLPDLLDQGVEVGKTVCKTFGCELVDDDGDGFNAKSVIQMG